MFAAPIPDELPLSDQPWFQQQFRATKVWRLPLRNLRKVPAPNTTVVLAEQQLIGLDYNQVLFAAHPFNQMEWRRSSHGGRWGMVDTASGSRPSVVHWNGPAHWCKTAAGGFGHNFISDYQRAALRVVGFWHTPLSASRHFASQDICVLRSRIVAGTAMRCKLSSCSAVGRCRYTKTSQAEKRDWPQNGNMGVRVGRLVLCCVPR